MKPVKHMVIVLGDQLNIKLSAFDGFDKGNDMVWMAEVREESEKVKSSKVRTVYFLSAMRHFKESLIDSGFNVHYVELDDKSNTGNFYDELKRAVKKLNPEKIILTEAGEYSIRKKFKETLDGLGVAYEVRPDNLFLASEEDFSDWAKGKKQLRMEYFYREMRKNLNVLMEAEKPVGDKWNYDKSNRGSFSKEGPESLPDLPKFKPDEVTEKVIELVNKEFTNYPGDLKTFNWPVTANQAKEALQDFISHRLPVFGDYQDAMWTDEPYLYHSLISQCINVRLLLPDDVIEAAEKAYHRGDVSIESAEGFIRQILGWREYIRGIYWYRMSDYLDENFLEAENDLPAFYWTGKTEMNCLSQVIGQTLKYGYAHHIQRLMVTGLFALLYGAKPQHVHEWYLAVYLDAIEWVELPNTLGMSQFVDGGVLASKPYVATGKYIKRMSNYCDGCEYNPDKATGEKACPFTTLYWDFLIRHQDKLSNNQRMGLQLRNLDRKSDEELKAIQKQASDFRAQDL